MSKTALTPADHLDAARTLLGRSDYAAAEPHLRALADNLPNNVQILSLLAHTYDQLEQYEASVRTYRALKPLLPALDMNFYACFTRALNKTGAFEETLILCKEAEAQKFQDSGLLYNKAMALDFTGNPEAAIENYTLAGQLPDPQGKARRQVGMLRLKLEDPAAIANEYSLDLLFERKKIFTSFKRWQGEPLAGKSLFIWEEQGIGDIIMYAGFLSHLLSQQVSITLAVAPDLMSIFQRSFPEIRIIAYTPEENARVEKKETFDYACPIGDLMHYCLTAYKPSSVKGFLKADPARIAATREKYATLGPGKTVGISWHTINYYTSMVRNIPLTEWVSLLQTPDCHFISLQYGYRDEELTAFMKQTGCKIHNIMECDPMTQREDFFAHVAAIDHVISVQNATVHIAGALGVDTLIMLPKCGDYRWRMQGTNSWWYPTVTIARQKEYRQWQPVMTEARKWLEKK